MTTHKDLKPPCYILGIETQIGLALIRELGEANIPVIGIALNEKAIGLKSRYLIGREILKNPRTEKGLWELQAIGKRYGTGVLLAISEINMKWLIENKASLTMLKVIAPFTKAFDIALDKTKTLELAKYCGIDVPISDNPNSWEDIEKIAQKFLFPAVLKWSDPNRIGVSLSRHNIKFLKAEYVYTAEEYLAASKRYCAIEHWPLIQEYCPGIGLGQFFFMYEGKPVRRFQHVRIAEWPPEGGFSSVCDGVPLDQFQELQEKSIQLLQKIGWEGVAMVEYRYDPQKSRAVLMEINGRFWGSFPLAYYSGAGFGILSYSLQGQGIMPELPPLRNDLRCRMVATELKRLKRILLEPDLIRDRSFVQRPFYEVKRFLIDFLRHSVRYYVWNRRDIKPFIRDIRNMLGL